MTYRNIRHAIWQSAEKELITLLHLHLHNPIMVGKKKVKDVQFYTEVMSDAAAVCLPSLPLFCLARCTAGHAGSSWLAVSGTG